MKIITNQFIMENKKILAGGIKLNSNQRNITFALMIATFLSAIEVTIISTAMPVITKALGGLELISWVFAIYLLTTAVTTPIFGKLSDLIGRKRVFVTGITIFLVGSLLCGFSQSMEQLIIYRGIQGLGAGALMPVTFAIIGDIFTYEQRARVQGLFSSIWAIAGILGPLVGGFFVDFLTWHWIFFINIPFGLVSIWMVAKFFDETVKKSKRKIDYGGAITFTVGMGLLLYALLSGGTDIAWNSTKMVQLLSISLFFIAIFIWIQLKHEEPIIVLGLFRNRAIAVSNFSSFILSAILIGISAYLPLWIQGVLLLGASYSGLTLIPMSLGWPLGAFVTGRLMVKVGTKPFSILGVVLIVVGTAALSTISIATPNLLLVIIMFVIGIGFGCAMTVFTVVVQSSVETTQRGAAAASNSFLRILGQTVGIAILGTVLNQRIGEVAIHEGEVPPEILASGLLSVFMILAMLAVLALVIAVWIPKQKPEH